VIADVPGRGNPNDDTLLEGAIAKAKAAGMQVRSVYADRGFGTSVADTALARHRVRDPVIPRRGRPRPAESRRNWKRRYRFRNGLEGRISQLKRKGLARTRLRSLGGTQTWSAASPSPTTSSGWPHSPDPGHAIGTNSNSSRRPPPDGRRSRFSGGSRASRRRSRQNRRRCRRCRCCHPGRRRFRPESRSGWPRRGSASAERSARRARRGASVR